MKLLMIKLIAWLNIYFFAKTIISRNYIIQISVWGYNVMVNNIIKSNYIFVENNKIEILFFNYIFGLTFQSPSSKLSLTNLYLLSKERLLWRWTLESKSEYIVRKYYSNFIMFDKNVLASSNIKWQQQDLNLQPLSS